MSEPMLLVKGLIGVLAGILAYRWGMLSEKLPSTRWRVISFCLLIVYATAIGIFIFYWH